MCETTILSCWVQNLFPDAEESLWWNHLVWLTSIETEKKMSKPDGQGTMGGNMFIIAMLVRQWPIVDPWYHRLTVWIIDSRHMCPESMVTFGCCQRHSHCQDHPCPTWPYLQKTIISRYVLQFYRIILQWTATFCQYKVYELLWNLIYVIVQVGWCVCGAA